MVEDAGMDIYHTVYSCNNISRTLIFACLIFMVFVGWKSSVKVYTCEYLDWALVQ